LSKLLCRVVDGQEEETNKDCLEEDVHYLMKTKVFFRVGIQLSQNDSPPQQYEADCYRDSRVSR
jgi:hypothetical protein